MKAPLRRRPSFMATLTVPIAAGIFARWWFSPTSQSPLLPQAGPASVIGIEDSATVLVALQSQAAVPQAVGTFPQTAVRVRLIGIEPLDDDAPACVWLEERLVGKQVELILDRRRLDRDDAWLAYVYLEGELVNAMLLREGLTRYASYPGDSATMGRQLRDAAKVGSRRTGQKIDPLDAPLEPTYGE